MYMNETEILEDIEKITRKYRRVIFRKQDQQLRIDKCIRILKKHPEAVLKVCADEYTGRRFGNAFIRKYCSEKIGKGKGYQLWMEW